MGRGGRGQSPYQGGGNYSYGGSALDSTNYQPRNGIVTPVSQLPFARNNYGGTFGGPVIIPGLYKNTNRRTSFQLNYSGNHATNLQDQYATVPTVAMRNGDFSGSPLQLVNPNTGLPFANNQIPVDQMSPAARALLAYIPTPNVDGAATQNFHTAATTLSTSNSVSVRINQNLTPTLPQRGAGAGGRGGGGRGGPGGGQAGPGGRGGRGLTINLSAQVQYRGNQSQQFNVLPQLGGTTKGTSVTVPISLTVAKGRTNNTFAVNVTRTKNTTSNAFANAIDVGALAGINYPTPQDPLNWGVPNLTFSNFNVRSNAANARSDLRTSLSYTWSRPVNRHQLRLGAEFRRDASSSQSNSNARGAFTFTGLYTRRRRVDRAGHRRRLRGLPARPAAASDAAGGGRHAAASEGVQRVLRGQLAAQQSHDVQPRPALGADLAVRRGKRPDGQSRCDARLYGRQRRDAGRGGRAVRHRLPSGR